MSRILDEMAARYGDRKGTESRKPVTRKQCERYLYGYMCHWISSELLKAHPSRRTRKMLVDSGFSMGKLSSQSDITDAIKRLS